MDKENDKLEQLFKQRFENEELPVPEGMWERMRPSFPPPPPTAENKSDTTRGSAAPWTKIITGIFLTTLAGGLIWLFLSRKAEVNTSAKNQVAVSNTVIQNETNNNTTNNTPENESTESDSMSLSEASYSSDISDKSENKRTNSRFLSDNSTPNTSDKSVATQNTKAISSTTHSDGKFSHPTSTQGQLNRDSKNTTTSNSAVLDKGKWNDTNGRNNNSNSTNKNVVTSSNSALNETNNTDAKNENASTNTSVTNLGKNPTEDVNTGTQRGNSNGNTTNSLTSSANTTNTNKIDPSTITQNINAATKETPSEKANSTKSNVTENSASKLNESLANSTANETSDQATTQTVNTPDASKNVDNNTLNNLNDNAKNTANVIPAVVDSLQPDSIKKDVAQGQEKTAVPDSAADKKEQQKQWRGNWLIEANGGLAFISKNNGAMSSSSGVDYQNNGIGAGPALELHAYRKLKGNWMGGVGFSYQQNSLSYSASSTRTENYTYYSDSSYYTYSQYFDTILMQVVTDSVLNIAQVPRDSSRFVSSETTQKIISTRFQIPLEISYQWRSRNIGMFASVQAIISIQRFRYGTFSQSGTDTQPSEKPTLPSNKITVGIGGTYGLRYFFGQHFFMSGRISYQFNPNTVLPKNTFSVMGGVGYEF